MLVVIFSLIAAALFFSGAYYVFWKGQVMWGITLMLAALIVGPGGIWTFA